MTSSAASGTAKSARHRRADDELNAKTAQPDRRFLDLRDATFGQGNQTSAMAFEPKPLGQITVGFVVAQEIEDRHREAGTASITLPIISVGTIRVNWK